MAFNRDLVTDEDRERIAKLVEEAPPMDLSRISVLLGLAPADRSSPQPDRLDGPGLFRD